MQNISRSKSFGKFVLIVLFISAFLKIAIILHLFKSIAVATGQGPTRFMKLFEILDFRITTMVWKNQATV